MRRFVFSALVVLCVAPLLQGQSFKGTWKGTSDTHYVYCSRGVYTNGTAALILTQQGNVVTGTFLWDAEETDRCNLTERRTYALRVAGTVEGSTLTSHIFYDGNPSEPETIDLGPLIAVVTGNTMTFEAILPTAEEDEPEDGPIGAIITGQVRRTAGTIHFDPNTNVVVSAFPSGMIQNAGQAPATDSFALTNTGTTPASVALSTADDFFTLPVTSITLAPGQTRQVDVQAVAQSTAGVRTGAITVAGAGVSSIQVTLLTGNTNVSANQLTAPPARTEVVATAERLLVGGTVPFTNHGTTALLAIAGSDVSWIIAPSGPITIPAGKTVPVTFQVDRLKRPDAAALIGGAAGNFSLRFVGSGSTASSQGVTQAITALNTVSAQIVDVVKPGTTNQPFPPLQAGEVAYFVLVGRGNKLTDLLLSNRATTKTTDLRMYFNSFDASAVTKLVNLPQGLQPNLAVTFPSMAKNVFDAVDQLGTLQIRGASASGMSIAAVQLASVAAGRYATALPVLRSDQSAGGGERINLAGLESSSTTHSALFIQEVAGVAGAVRVDFVSAVGAPLLPSRAADPVAGFALLELPVPAGAALARINVMTGSAARFAAYALVSDDLTGDSWAVADITRTTAPPSSSFVVPLVAVNGQAPKRNLYLTNNASNSALDVVVDQVGSSARWRAIAHAVAADATITIPPSQTVAPPIADGDGYLRITAPPGSFSLGARATAGTAAGGVFGTGLIAVAGETALKAGASKRITGFDDSAATRSTLILVETAGQSATVRLTLRFTFAGGTKVSAYAASTQTIELTPRQMLTLPDVARSIIGTQRDTFGDLLNCQLDVEVTGGTGAVVALVQSVDNASGDVVMRD